MAELTRVPAPGSPFDGWRGRIVGLIAIGLVLAIVKPWGGDRVVAVASPAPTRHEAQVPVVVSPVGRPYDPATFGPDAPTDEWAIVTTTRRSRLEFMDPADSLGGSDPAAATGPVIVAGPVVDLGTTDALDAFAIVHPREQSLATIRAWQFVDGSAPRRVDLDILAPPWPVDHVTVVARRTAGMEAGRVLAWEPGLYRLDLLIDPGAAIRSVMLAVSPGAAGAGGTASRGVEPARSAQSFQPSTLHVLPEAANLWSSGGVLSGWRRETTDPGCRIAEIWQATDPDDACWPIPLGRTSAVGVNLPDEVVTSIDLLGIDPLPGPVGVETQVDVDGKAGRALVRAPVGGLPDGIYRLDVALEGGADRSWYFEVGPIGRAVARYYEASASR